MFSLRLTHRSQGFLDDNDEILRAQDRKQGNRIFQAIQQGEFDIEVDFVDSPASTFFFLLLSLSSCRCTLFVFLGCQKNKHIPEELRDQWERDRAKKAERKRLRELERIAAAADPFMVRKGKGGKKARKAKL